MTTPGWRPSLKAGYKRPLTADLQPTAGPSWLNDRLFAGTTTMGATVLGLNHVLHAGVGATVIGPLGNNFAGAEFLANTLSGAGIEAPVNAMLCQSVLDRETE